LRVGSFSWEEIVGTLRDIQRQAGQEARQRRKAEHKAELLRIISDLRAKYAGHSDILVKMCNDLNNQGVRTLKGLAWNSKGLWAFMNQNTDVPDANTQVGSQQTVREGVQQMLDLSLRLVDIASFLRSVSDTEHKKTLVQEFMDADLMALVARKMELDGVVSLAELLERLLKKYLTSEKP
jgi:hypothetical protein